MNARILGALPLVLMAALPVAIPAAAASVDANQASLVVNGSAAISREPDVARVAVSIETNADGAAAATQRNAALTARVRSAVEGLGIPAKAIVTQYYDLRYQPRPEPTAEPLPMRRPAALQGGPRYGYVVTHTLEITVEPAQVGSVIDTGTQAGATSIGGVTYDITGRHAVFLQALRAAIADARSQARAAAEAAGARLGPIRRIFVNGESRVAAQTGPILMRTESPSVPTEVTPGVIRIFASVSITYDLSP